MECATSRPVQLRFPVSAMFPEKEITVTIQIGNSDNKLTQLEWHKYVISVNAIISRHTDKLHFSGGSPSDAPWQNYCWVIVLDDKFAVTSLKLELARHISFYLQDSIAFTVGYTELVCADD